MKKIIILIAIIFTLTGCYNYRELNDIAIVSAIGINKTNDNYEVVVQVMNTKKSGENNDSKDQTEFVVYKAKGKTIQSALRNIILKSPRRLYINHMQVLIIDDDMAKEGFHDILDWFARDSESRKQFYVLVSDDSTEDVLNTLTPLESLNSKHIKDSLETNTKFLGAAKESTFESVLKDYMNDKQELVIPSIKVTKNINDDEILLSNLAIFKKDKLLGYLSEDQSITANLIRNSIKSTIVNYKCDSDKYITSEIISYKTSIKANTSKNPKVTINIKGKANINEMECNWNLEEEKTIKKINSLLENRIKTMIITTTDYVYTKYESDIFGFKDLFYKENPEYYKDNIGIFNDSNLKNIKVEVNANIDLAEKGNILQVITR